MEEAEACCSAEGHFEDLRSHTTVSLELTHLIPVGLLTFRLETPISGLSCTAGLTFGFVAVASCCVLEFCVSIVASPSVS